MLACTRCEVIDISGQRVASFVKAELEKQGYRFYREESVPSEETPHSGTADELAERRRNRSPGEG